MQDDLSNRALHQEIEDLRDEVRRLRQQEKPSNGDGSGKKNSDEPEALQPCSEVAVLNV